MLINPPMIRHCLFVLLMTILPLAANGIIGKLYEYDKLTNSLVTQLCQDKYGYVWIASDFGLNRFDGYHFVNYYYSSRDSLSIPHNLVRSLLCTKDGEMFIGTGKGLARYDYTTDKFHRFRFPGDIQPRVNSLVEMPSGNLLVCTAGYGVYVLNRRDMKLSEEKSYSNLAANNYLSGFYVEDAGTVWCFTNDRRIVRFVVNGDKAVSFRSHQPKGAIPSSIVKDSNGKPLFVMDNALMRYDNKNGRFVDAGYGYWVGTWQSLYLYDPISDKSVLFHDLDHKGSPFIAEDKFGNIYISIFGEGFAVYDGKSDGLRYYNSRTTAKDR